MSKPICVIYLPENISIGGDGYGEAPMKLMEVFNNYFGQEPPQGHISNDYWKDYYWFCFTKYEISEPEFKVFYEKDFTDIQFAELKELILKSIEEMKIKK